MKPAGRNNKGRVGGQPSNGRGGTTLRMEKCGRQIGGQRRRGVDGCPFLPLPPITVGGAEGAPQRINMCVYDLCKHLMPFCSLSRCETKLFNKAFSLGLN